GRLSRPHYSSCLATVQQYIAVQKPKYLFRKQRSYCNPTYTFVTQGSRPFQSEMRLWLTVGCSLSSASAVPACEPGTSPVEAPVLPKPRALPAPRRIYSAQSSMRPGNSDCWHWVAIADFDEIR